MPKEKFIFIFQNRPFFTFYPKHLLYLGKNDYFTHPYCLRAQRPARVKQIKRVFPTKAHKEQSARGAEQ
jgi:hypothetical protein